MARHGNGRTGGPLAGPAPPWVPDQPRPAGGAGRGAYNPALDGVRALAVLCVLVFHLDSLPGGYLGVDVFFVLSGFLITRGLLAERDLLGGVSLRRFYLRRARRLLPAFCLLVLVGATSVLLLGVGPAGERAEFLDSLVASTLYVNNYFQVVRQSTGAGWLGHTWSLSLEEQFYLLWPLLLLVLCRRPSLERRLPVILLGGVAAVLLWREVLAASGASATRMYFGLDTRADALLVGCGLAAWLRPTRQRRSAARAPAAPPAVVPPRAVLPAAGLTALVLLAVGTAIAPNAWGPRPTVMCHGGYTAAALLAGVVILALERGATSSWLFRALAARPLAWLGRISYGFYLWHFPVVAHWGRGLTAALGRWPAILAVGVISAALAAASYYLLERPIQRRRPARPRRRPRRGAVGPVGLEPAGPPRRAPAVAGSTGPDAHGRRP